MQLFNLNHIYGPPMSRDEDVCSVFEASQRATSVLSRRRQLVRLAVAVRAHSVRLACHPVDCHRVTVDVGDRPMDAIPLLNGSTGSCHFDSLGGDCHSKRQQHYFHRLSLANIATQF
jgi:hypothetical protein